MASLSTRVTATLANASERRSITFEYQQTPIYHTPVTVEATLDENGCLAVELPFTEAQIASVDLDDEVKLFLEPGDQLHLDADLLDLSQSLRFSGQGAANNQFLAALRSRFPDYLRIDYEDLAVDAHRKIIDQRRSELERFLDEGCSQYQLTPAFVNYYRAEIINDFQRGRFDQGEQRLAEFLQDNPYPEYTETVEKVMRETSKFKPGQPAPDFTLDDLEGQSVSLSDFKGQAVFLDFWSRGCLPCVEDFPYLEQIKQQTRDQKVVFLSISLDSGAAWHQAIEEHGLTGVHVHSPGGWQAAVAQLYQIRSIPTYLLVGPDGRMAGRVDDVWDVAEVVARIEEVASGKVPSSKSGQSGIIIKG